MKKSVSIFLFILFVAGIVFGQENQNAKKSVLDPSSALALQDVPFYEGVDDFSKKIQKIREEEGREPLCLVMCGGSARAFCHIGVLKAMEENNIVPDFIVANSMGAVIGMLYAYGFSPQYIEEVISRINLSSYFEPVLPLQGGLLSVRKYEALINQLLGEESHRVEDCAIPILLLTEDLYTKRQVWHASGDFAKVMDAAFAMSAFMDPVLYELEDGTKVSLIDSGAIDIAGLKVAKSFSDNLIVSTAFYDKPVDYKNPLVIINRTMSIGKERVAIRDIMNLQPVLIRNDVEHFSFMDFQKCDEIAEAGYKTATEMMDELLSCQHGTLSGNEKLQKRRTVTNKLAEEEIIRVEHRIPATIVDPYFGMKVWPVFGVVDFPDAYVYNRDGLALEAFADLPGIMFKAKANFPFDFQGVAAEGQITAQPTEVFRVDLLGSYYFDFTQSQKNNFYAFGGINISPVFFPEWMKSLVLSGEYKTDKAFKSEYMLFTAGVKNLFGKENDSYLYEKPFVYTEGTDLKDLGFGLGNDLAACWNFFKYTGVGEYSNLKYNISKQLLSIDNRNELYFVNRSPDVTFAELLILQQIKMGGYYEIQSTYSVSEKNFNNNQIAGAFIRGDVSVIGLSTFIIDGGYGWNLNEKKGFGFISLKARI